MMGTNRIDCAPVVIKKTPPIYMFFNTVSCFYGIEILFDKKRNLNTKVFGDTRDFIFPDIYNPGVPGTAYPASLAFKMNALIKKIGSIEYSFHLILKTWSFGPGQSYSALPEETLQEFEVNQNLKCRLSGFILKL
jgi:hypothetical protein